MPDAKKCSITAFGKCGKYGLKLKSILRPLFRYLYQHQKKMPFFLKVGRNKLILFLVMLTFFSAIIVSNKIVRMKRQAELFVGSVMETPTCRHPDLPIDNPEIMKHIVNVDKITCDVDPDWVVVNGTHAFVTEEAKSLYDAPIVCKFYEIVRVDDDVTKFSERITQGQWYKFEAADFVKVSCSARRERWSTYLAVPRATVPVPGPVESKSPLHPKLNVVMWGHDSLSRNMFKRKLPLAHKYLTKELHGIVLQGYNIVGDGTPQALIPILTGKTELELPETRKRKGSQARHVNVYPFIWNEFSKKGYLTGYMEDCPSIGTFTYRLKGFGDAPTDFYMRTFFTAAQSQYSKFSKYCIGSVPRHKKMLDYIKYIMNFKRNFGERIPKFVFGFHSELSHGDTNAVQGADSDLREFLADLHLSGNLNSTILIVMSDHGHRFAAIRETQQGKQEERMPMFMFVLPAWFRRVYPTAYGNLLTNAHRLSTPFDIHATFQDILNLESLSANHFSVPNPLASRQMSLFREIPLVRSCANADIEPHWCACLQWRNINPNASIAQRAGLEFVNYLNVLTDSHREMCSELELGKILWAAHFHPTEELLRFKKNADEDGFEPDLSDHTEVASTLLQLKVETIPGNGHFEVSLTYDVTNYQFTIKETDISRINKYAMQAKCVETNEKLEHLRKYCYCKD